MEREKPPVAGVDQALNQDQGSRVLDGGGQLGLFSDDQGGLVPVEVRAGPGRPAGSPNKTKAKVREYFTARGYRDPAEQLALIAGLDRPDLHPLGHAALLAEITGLDLMDMLKLQRQAAADLLPYWHAKLTPDVAIQANQMNIMMAAPTGATGPQQRVVGPPPLPTKESLTKQQVNNPEDADNSDESRTE